jgi:hypothetical protein
MRLDITVHLALPRNIRLGWKWLTVTNALAYITAVVITTVKNYSTINSLFN